jgi:hypothetical protein
MWPFVPEIGPLPELLCDNPQQNDFYMRSICIFLLGVTRSILVGVLASVLATAQTPNTGFPKAQASVPLVLAGGTVVDVTNWANRQETRKIRSS